MLSHSKLLFIFLSGWTLAGQQPLPPSCPSSESVSLNLRKHDTAPRSFLFFLSVAAVLSTFQRFATCNGPPRYLKTLKGVCSSMHNRARGNHESLVCCFRCACKLPGAGLGVRKLFLFVAETDACVVIVVADCNSREKCCNRLVRLELSN